jgi:hypothetical protein
MEATYPVDLAASQTQRKEGFKRAKTTSPNTPALNGFTEVSIRTMHHGVCAEKPWGLPAGLIVQNT